MQKFLKYPLAATIVLASSLALPTVGNAQPVKQENTTAAALGVSTSACYKMTIKQLKSSSFPKKTPTSCTSKHNLEVTAVLTVPARYAKFGLSSTAVKTWKQLSCSKYTLNYYYANDMTRLDKAGNLAWQPLGFLPSSSQWRKGSRQLVCGGTQTSWDGKAYLVSGSVKETQRFVPWCGRFVPRANTWKWAKCSNSKAREIIAIETLGWKNMPTKRFPGANRVVKRAVSIASRTGAGWFAPSAVKANWDAGNRWVYLFSNL